jgi:hypothetical protein
MFNEDNPEQDDNVLAEATEQKEATSEDVVSADELKVKFYSVELPSKGRLGYPESVEYRDIMVRDEKVLSSATPKTYADTLNKVLKSLLKDPSIYDKLCIYDRDFLLLWIWANNYSTEKQFEVYCPVCTTKDTVDINLTKIDIVTVSDDLKVPFPLDLSNGETVNLRLLTVQDEAVAKKFATHHKMNEADVKFALAMEFKTRLPLADKIRYIDNNVTGRDMGRIRAFHDRFKFGLEDKVKHECTGCGEVTPHEIPFSGEFLLPTLQADFEKILRSN